MRTLKLILAWLDWSTYCSSLSDKAYSFPKTLCPLFWRTIFSIILIPSTWFGHIINIFVTKNNFKDEFAPDWKFSYGITLGLHFLILFFGHLGFEFWLGKEYIHSCSFFEGYFLLFCLGIIHTALFFGLIALCFVIYFACSNLIKYLRRNKKRQVTSYVVGEIKNSIKNKYCPRIDWSVIKNKK